MSDTSTVKADYIEAFLKAVYPECTELATAFNSEKSCLTDATKCIIELRKQVAALIAERNTLNTALKHRILLARRLKSDSDRYCNAITNAASVHCVSAIDGCPVLDSLAALSKKQNHS